MSMCHREAGKRGTDWVREVFLEFFVQRGHAIYSSSPVVPVDDDTLLFANAGMNQFKGVLTCETVAKDTKVCSVQKCIRAGGKHNDLETVGSDSYHHTFFEMLGTWSFNDYTHCQAIAWAWEFLTQRLALPADRFYATYHRDDPDTRLLWLKWLPEERVLPFGDRDNFWEMGSTGPCGPCTEIHFDRVGGRNAAHLVNMDDPDVIELWNLVFIDRERLLNGSTLPLPQKHIDTGMGLERLAGIVEGVDNYETNSLRSVIAAAEVLCKAEPYGGTYGGSSADIAYRIVADHIRSIVVTIADGAHPGNTGRNYVIRRLIRRAMRAWTETLAADVSMALLVPAVVRSPAHVYPTVEIHYDKINAAIDMEEASFAKNIKRGGREFKKLAAKGHLSGADVFKLWDAYRFPTDLTRDLSLKCNVPLDMTGFDTCMETQRAMSQRRQLVQKG
jgi:alanyl-tRNA synthetase